MSDSIPQLRIDRPDGIELNMETIDNVVVNVKTPYKDLPAAFTLKEILSAKWTRNDPGKRGPLSRAEREAKAAHNKARLAMAVLITELYYTQADLANRNLEQAQAGRKIGDLTYEIEQVRSSNESLRERIDQANEANIMLRKASAIALELVAQLMNATKALVNIDTMQDDEWGRITIWLQLNGCPVVYDSGMETLTFAGDDIDNLSFRTVGGKLTDVQLATIAAYVAAMAKATAGPEEEFLTLGYPR